MGAIACETIDWGGTEFELYGTSLFARGVNVQRTRRCPHCGSIVSSRRHKLCGVCCEPLPAGCTFSEKEAAMIKSIFDEERERHRKWLGKVNYTM